MIPVVGAIQAYLAIFNNLPVSISSYISLSLALFFIVGIFRIILRL